jgi:hypothetical protein
MDWTAVLRVWIDSSFVGGKTYTPMGGGDGGPMNAGGVTAYTAIGASTDALASGADAFFSGAAGVVVEAKPTLSRPVGLRLTFCLAAGGDAAAAAASAAPTPLRRIAPSERSEVG